MDFGLNAKIFYLCVQGLSNRAIGRLLYVSEHCVRLRIQRLAQRAFVFHANTVKDFKIAEPICYDGLENFAGSQYNPNNIQQAIGRESLFIYDFNFASLNRKGRMSVWQKVRLKEIESEFGRYNPKNIRITTKNILRRLYLKSEDKKKFTLFSDEHFQYRKVIRKNLRQLRINHITVSSKACRNFQNILFPVNHADLIIRKQLAAFTRETISFSKKSGAMCQKYMLFATFKNFMASQFTKKHVRRPEAHVKSPAQMLGLKNKILRFSDIFNRRSFAKEVMQLNSDWRYFWRGEIPRSQNRNTIYT